MTPPAPDPIISEADIQLVWDAVPIWKPTPTYTGLSLDRLRAVAAEHPVEFAALVEYLKGVQAVTALAGGMTLV
jgi:hypothetical protein